MTQAGFKQNNLDFYSISRSHLYWGRKPTNGLSEILKDLKSGEILLDPFCGGGTPIITALLQGARVIGCDLNPIAVFLTKTLIRPVSIFALREAFRQVRESVAESMLQNYMISCPGCRSETYFDYLKWNTLDGNDIPEAVKVTCKHCGFSHLVQLSTSEISRQLSLVRLQPGFWFPRNVIRAERKTKATFFYQLFTERNLTSLAALFHAIQNTSSKSCRGVLQYVFTGMLYSCSQMQMFSSKDPSSSRGWTAPRFYLPRVRKEKNVWKAFEIRFKTVLNCREKLNSLLGSVRISDSLREFERSDNMAYIYQSDFSTIRFPKKSRITHVFLDPPYNVDVDYMGLSEFWGCWLGMTFDIQAGWHPGRLTPEENARKLRDLLLQIRENTASSCPITLAYGAKKAPVLELIGESVSEAGFDLKEISPILWDNPQKRKAAEFPPTDRYFLLKRKLKRTKAVDNGLTKTDSKLLIGELDELRLFVRVAASLFGNSSPDRIRERAYHLIPAHLQTLFPQLKLKQLQEWIRDEQENCKAYHTLCLSLMEPILLQDGYKVIAAEASQFDDSEPAGYAGTKHLPNPAGIGKGADFIAENVKGHRLLFCFHEKHKEDSLKRISNRGYKTDGNTFHTIWFAISQTHEEMIKCRSADKAENWPRGFFLCIGELTQKAIELSKSRFGHLEYLTTRADYRSREKVKYFTADVISNDPVSDRTDCRHFKLKFKAPELTYVVPGQFVMLDTLPVKKRRDIEERPLKGTNKHYSYDSVVDLTPTSFLKRPFSIHRAYYKHFDPGYLKNMSLPPTLATVSHTHFPHEFLIFYKVLEDGIGTNELRRVKSGDRVEMLGPLGRFPALSKWRGEGIEEVHLVGGGVGMAPLVFFGQALKFYSFKLRAFIGIDRIETLLYSAPLAPTFAEDPHNAYVYIESLSGIGLKADEINVSCEVMNGNTRRNGRLPEANYHEGFVTEQYESYLKSVEQVGGLLVIACGPQPMLTSLERITSNFNVPMKVLLEKRMACGIGVCLSCVCRTKKLGSQEYSRVCTEGPLFDSTDIYWE